MTSRYNRLASVAVSAIFLAALVATATAHAEEHARGAEVVTNGPQVNPGDRPDSQSAQRNMRDSQRYEALTHSSSSFRADRMRRECGTIRGRRMHAECVASFDRHRGSSRPDRGDRNDR